MMCNLFLSDTFSILYQWIKYVCRSTLGEGQCQVILHTWHSLWKVEIHRQRGKRLKGLLILHLYKIYHFRILIYLHAWKLCNYLPLRWFHFLNLNMKLKDASFLIKMYTFMLSTHEANLNVYLYVEYLHILCCFICTQHKGIHLN
jgi:hypothetical protein